MPSHTLPRFVVPAVTPLADDGSVDTESLARLLDHLVTGGAEGILLLGSTGEVGSLGAADRLRALDVARVCLKSASVALFVGLPSLGLRGAIEEAKALEHRGAIDYFMVPPPFFFQLSGTELAAFYRGLHGSVATPLVAYDVPIRVQVNLSPETISELAADGTIVGLKDSSLDLEKAARTVRLLDGREGFGLWSGAECSALGYLAHGYTGIMPGICNVEPRPGADLCAAATAGDWVAARRAQNRIIDLTALFRVPLTDSSVSPRALGALKMALHHLGIVQSPRCAEPFTQGAEVFSDAVRSAMLALGMAPLDAGSHA